MRWVRHVTFMGQKINAKIKMVEKYRPLGKLTYMRG
jgi:hypothetical protein